MGSRRYNEIAAMEGGGVSLQGSGEWLDPSFPPQIFWTGRTQRYMLHGEPTDRIRTITVRSTHELLDARKAGMVPLERVPQDLLLPQHRRLLNLAIPTAELDVVVLRSTKTGARLRLRVAPEKRPGSEYVGTTILSAAHGRTLFGQDLAADRYPAQIEAIEAAFGPYLDPAIAQQVQETIEARRRGERLAIAANHAARWAERPDELSGLEVSQ